MRSVFLLASALSLAGCLYAHDSDLQKTAEDAQVAFQAVATDGTTQKILQSKTEFDKAMQDALDAAQQRHFDVQIQSVPGMSWASLFEQTAEEQKEAKDDLVKIDAAIKESNQSLTAAMAKLDPAAAKATDALGAVNAAADAEARYAATQIVLREGIKALGKDEPSLDDYNKMLQETIPTRSFTVSKGVLEEKSEDKAVKDILNLPAISLSGSKPSIEDLGKLYGIGKDLPKLAAFKDLDFTSPGLAAAIMSLGYDVARAEELRIRAEIDREKSRNTLLKQKLELRKQQVSTLEGDFFVSQQDYLLATYVAKPESRIGDSLEAYSSSGVDRVTRRQKLTEILYYLAANYQDRVVVPDQLLRLDDQVAVAASDHALALANVNLMERQALISRGLEGLVAFHRGGISADDVANFLRLAQAIGLFAIAGGWL